MPRRAVTLVTLLSLATACLVGGTVVGCNVMHPDATTRLARTFDIEEIDGLERQEVTGAIEAAVAAKLPLGTGEAVIREYLAARGVGQDGLSSMSDLDDGSRLLCRFEFDPRHFAILHSTHWVVFTLDAERKLTKIAAKTEHTGP